MTAPERAPRHRHLPVVHLLSDDEVLARPDFVSRAAALMREGGSALAVHVRGHETQGRRSHDLALQLQGVARDTGAWLIINDRIDVAMAVEANGVQLAQHSLSLNEARAVGGASLRFGVSVHGADEARAALGADWLLVGTLWATPSHQGLAGAGTDRLVEVARVNSAPRIGVGGITPQRAREVRDHGGAGVAVLRGIWAAPHPIEALNEYLTAWHDT